MTVLGMLFLFQFLELLLGGTWEDTVCDPTLFHTTFTFPADLDADDLQYKLCEEARNNDTAYIEEILKSVNIEKLMEEVSKPSG